MTKLFFQAENCQGVTSDRTGKFYPTDKQGFIHVSDPGDAAFLKEKGGYLEAGGMPHFSRYWICDDCSWESTINHCRYCDSENLRKVEA